MTDSSQHMKAAQGSGFGDESNLSVENGVPTPKLSDEYSPTESRHPIVNYASRQDRKTHMIIKTLAVALAPGDCRVLSGKTAYFQGPPSFPYIPGGDCCGIVVEPCPGDDYFKVGDIVAVRFTNAPRDALAEYARVSTVCCEKIDEDISPEDAAALASASPATLLCEYIQEGDRVLILGAGGGIGSHLCQLARFKKAAYVCGVSRSPQRMLQKPVVCDDAIDYTKEDPFESAKYKQDKFDLIIDLSCGGWPRLQQSVRNGHQIVKPANKGGRFVTITTDEPTFEGNSFWDLISLFLFKPMGRMIWSRVFSRSNLPTFTNADCLPNSREVMTRTFQLVKDGHLQAVVDGPYPFSTSGVREAFRRLKDRHPHGKVVIKL